MQKSKRTVGSIQKPSLGAICMPAHYAQWHDAPFVKSIALVHDVCPCKRYIMRYIIRYNKR